MDAVTKGVRHRKAITPVIATVLIIAVTLVASVAIGGFVFGLMGSQTSSAQVSAVNAALVHAASGSSVAVQCSSSPSGAYGYVQLSNIGTANTQVSAVSLTYGGNTYSATLTSCGSTNSIDAGNAIYLQFTAIPASAAGQQYSGFVVTSNGAQVVFSGTLN